jgi:hypothetical protein
VASRVVFGDAGTFLLERSYLHDAKDDPLSVLPILDRMLRLHPRNQRVGATLPGPRPQRRESHLEAAQDMLALRRVDPIEGMGTDNVIWMLNTLLHAARGYAAHRLTRGERERIGSSPYPSHPSNVRTDEICRCARRS